MPPDKPGDNPPQDFARFLLRRGGDDQENYDTGCALFEGTFFLEALCTRTQGSTQAGAFSAAWTTCMDSLEHTLHIEFLQRKDWQTQPCMYGEEVENCSVYGVWCL